MSGIEASCQHCIYRQPDERPDYSTSGFCHRYPARIIAMTYNFAESSDPEQFYPWVTPDDWCGEYRARSALNPSPEGSGNG